MSWRHVDLGARTWTIPGSTRKGPRTQARPDFVMPLPDLAVRELERLPRRPVSPFRQLAQAWGHRWTSVEAATGVLGGFHQLRHTVATRVGELPGAPPYAVEVVLGHRLHTGPAAIYDHARRLVDHRAWLEAWAVELQRIVEAPE